MAARGLPLAAPIVLLSAPLSSACRQFVYPYDTTTLSTVRSCTPTRTARQGQVEDGLGLGVHGKAWLLGVHGKAWLLGGTWQYRGGGACTASPCCPTVRYGSRLSSHVPLHRQLFKRHARLLRHYGYYGNYTIQLHTP